MNFSAICSDLCIILLLLNYFLSEFGEIKL